MNGLENKKVEELFSVAKDYTNNRIYLFKIQIAQKTAELTSKLIFVFVLSILLFFSLLFFGFMLAFFLAEKFNSNFYGFAIVAAISILLIPLFFILFKKIISNKLKDIVAHAFFMNEVNADDDNE